MVRTKMPSKGPATDPSVITKKRKGDESQPVKGPEPISPPAKKSKKGTEASSSGSKKGKNSGAGKKKKSAERNRKGKQAVVEQAEQPKLAGSSGQGKKKKKPRDNSITNRNVRCERMVHAKNIGEAHPVIKILNQAGLTSFYKAVDGYVLDLVREFYSGLYLADMVLLVLKTTVRGKTIIITPDVIAEHLGYVRPAEEEIGYPTKEFVALTKEAYAERMCEPESFEGKFVQGAFKDDYRLMNKIIHYNIYPKSSEKTPNQEKVEILHEVMAGTTIDFARLRWDVMKEFISSQRQGNMPFGHMVTQLCYRAGLKKKEQDQFFQPLYGPITLVTENKSRAMSAQKSQKPKEPATAPQPPPNDAMWLWMEEKLRGWHGVILKRQEGIEKEQKELRGRVEYAVSLLERSLGISTAGASTSGAAPIGHDGATPEAVHTPTEVIEPEIAETTEAEAADVQDGTTEPREGGE